jgi:hypothetical protein
LYSLLLALTEADFLGEERNIALQHGHEFIADLKIATHLLQYFRP